MFQYKPGSYVCGDHDLSDEDRLATDLVSLRGAFDGMDFSGVPDDTPVGDTTVGAIRYAIARQTAGIERVLDNMGYTNEVKLAMATYDWDSAMEYAVFAYSDIVEIIGSDEGQNDGNSWLLLVLLKNGKYATLNAWCDYTGWDCQAGGESNAFLTLDEAKDSFAESDLKRMGIAYKPVALTE